MGDIPAAALEFEEGHAERLDLEALVDARDNDTYGDTGKYVSLKATKHLRKRKTYRGTGRSRRRHRSRASCGRE